jgi:hypothetical protein
MNPYTCVVASGCSYLPYTHETAKSYYSSQAFLGILFILTGLSKFFIKYDIGGRAFFDDIQMGLASTTGSFFGTTPEPMIIGPRYSMMIRNSNNSMSDNYAL